MPDHIDRAAEVLEVHEVVFIDHEVGYECGCNEHGDGHLDGLPFLTDALKHQVRALEAAGLLASPEHDRQVIEKFLRERDTPSVRIENPEFIAPLLAKAWDEGFEQGGPMHDVNCDDPDAHTRNPYERAT